MKIEVSLVNRNLVVDIDGDIDHHSSEEIREKVDKEFERLKARNIIFNFKKVNFMDSSGIGMIIGRYKNTEKQGGNVAVCNISENVERIFNISGLKKIVKYYKSIEESLESFN